MPLSLLRGNKVPVKEETVVVLPQLLFSDVEKLCRHSHTMHPMYQEYLQPLSLRAFSTVPVDIISFLLLVCVFTFF